jgi:hypothetical protein
MTTLDNIDISSDLLIDCNCECCRYRWSSYVCTARNGITVVVSHICSSCKGELEGDETIDFEYKFSEKSL